MVEHTTPRPPRTGQPVAPPAPAVSRWVVLAMLVMFLCFWFLSLDQYLYAFALALVAFLVGRNEPARVDPPLTTAMLATVALAAAYLPVSAYLGNTVRTLDVWLAGTVLVLATYKRPTAAGFVIRTLLGIWLLSLSVYALSLVAPAATDALIAAKMSSGLASSTAFWTPSEFAGVSVLRPIGFALYANELALFGIIVVALYIWRIRPRILSSLVLLSLATAGLLLSTSRSLALSMAVALVCWMLMQLAARSPARTQFQVVVVATVVAIASFVIIAAPSMLQTLVGQFDSIAEARFGASAELRDLSYVVGWELFTKNPITGMGGLPDLGHIQAGSHSFPLSMAVRHGIPGLAIAIALLITMTTRGVRALLGPDHRLALVGATLIGAVPASFAIQFDDDMLSFVIIVIACAAVAPTRGSAGDLTNVSSTRKMRTPNRR